MKKILCGLIAGIIGFAGLLTPLTTAPVYADEEGDSSSGSGSDCYEGAILSNCEDPNNPGSGITKVLNIIVNVLAVGVGVLAAVGIAIVGTQYLTAGGNEEQTRRAKRRLVEIVIGVAAYVLIYALLYWLLPGFKGIGG